MQPLVRPVDHNERRRRAVTLLNSAQFIISESTYRPRFGKIVAAIAWVMFLLIEPLLDLLRHFLPLIIAIPVYFLALADLTRRSHTALHRTALDAILESHEPPILYLRPFILDDRKGSFSWVPTLDYASKDIFKQLEQIGPVIEIDNPHSKRVGFGPHRAMLTPLGDWQHVVTELMLCSQLVVIYISAVLTTENVIWELARARELVAPTRLVIRVPRLGDRGRHLLSSIIEASLGVRITEWKKAELIRFDQNWCPELVSGLAQWVALRQQLATDQSWNPPFVDWEYGRKHYSQQTNP